MKAHQIVRYFQILINTENVRESLLGYNQGDKLEIALDCALIGERNATGSGRSPCLAFAPLSRQKKGVLSACLRLLRIDSERGLFDWRTETLVLIALQQD